MPPQFVVGSPLLEVAWAAGILLVFVLGGWLILVGARYAQRKLEKKSKRALLPQLLRSLYRPVFLLVILQGFILALSSLSYLVPWRAELGKVATALAIILVTYGLARSGVLLLGWYMHRAKVRKTLSSLLERTAFLLVYVAGLLVLLDYLGISITPMIAGLGLGGLAIALALQPTLSNFFAGVQVVFDKMVREGDYIELDSGTTGYVVDVGWRSTRIRTAYNNSVIVPNARLVDSIITNYYGPNMELAVIVESGVSYSSDLAHVESVALEVAREVIEELDEVVKIHDPWFGFDEFGDSNINFWVWLYAKDRISSFRVKSELIKRLHARFDLEGITINYPVRMLTYEQSKEKKPLLPFDNRDFSGVEEKR